jgi:hypothetical protein
MRFHTGESPPFAVVGAPVLGPRRLRGLGRASSIPTARWPRNRQISGSAPRRPLGAGTHLTHSTPPSGRNRIRSRPHRSHLICIALPCRRPGGHHLKVVWGALGVRRHGIAGGCHVATYRSWPNGAGMGCGPLDIAFPQAPGRRPNGPEIRRLQRTGVAPVVRRVDLPLIRHAGPLRVE